MGVEADPVTQRAAEQRGDGQIERLALDVPERHFDGGQCAAADHAGHAVAHHGDKELLPELFDLERVLADEQGRQVAHRGFDDPRPAAAFAHPVNAFVGMDFDKEPIAGAPSRRIGYVGVHEKCLNIGNLHR